MTGVSGLALIQSATAFVLRTAQCVELLTVP